MWEIFKDSFVPLILSTGFLVYLVYYENRTTFSFKQKSIISICCILLIMLLTFLDKTTLIKLALFILPLGYFFKILLIDLVIQFSPDTPKQQYPYLSIVAIFFKRKLESSKKLVLILSAVSLNYYIFAWIVSIPMDENILLVWIGICSLLLLKLYILSFRIKHGYYGNNRKETIEIINFIISQSENIDFTDGDGLKKIFSKEDLKEFQENWVGDWQGVRK